MPSRLINKSAIASAGGVLKETMRQRDLIVINTSLLEGAQRIHIVNFAGSSIAFNNAFPASVVKRSASSKIIMFH